VAGFELLEHTADVGIRARGATLEEAFEQATLGLAEVMGALAPSGWSPGGPGGSGGPPGWSPGGSGEAGPWGDDWALVIPDTVEPVTHLWAEAGDEAGATALADEYEALIRRAAELE
jgi:Archease protein family (MTH1598/TM1083)